MINTIIQGDVLDGNVLSDIAHSPVNWYNVSNKSHKELLTWESDVTERLMCLLKPIWSVENAVPTGNMMARLRILHVPIVEHTRMLGIDRLITRQEKPKRGLRLFLDGIKTPKRMQSLTQEHDFLYGKGYFSVYQELSHHLACVVDVMTCACWKSTTRMVAADWSCRTAKPLISSTMISPLGVEAWRI
jgi:hypothetical protein